MPTSQQPSGQQTLAENLFSRLASAASTWVDKHSQAEPNEKEKIKALIEQLQKPGLSPEEEQRLLEELLRASKGIAKQVNAQAAAASAGISIAPEDQTKLMAFALKSTKVLTNAFNDVAKENPELIKEVTEKVNGVIDSLQKGEFPSLLSVLSLAWSAFKVFSKVVRKPEVKKLIGEGLSLMGTALKNASYENAPQGLRQGLQQGLQQGGAMLQQEAGHDAKIENEMDELYEQLKSGKLTPQEFQRRLEALQQRKELRLPQNGPLRIMMQTAIAIMDNHRTIAPAAKQPGQQPVAEKKGAEDKLQGPIGELKGVFSGPEKSEPESSVSKKSEPESSGPKESEPGGHVHGPAGPPEVEVKEEGVSAEGKVKEEPVRLLATRDDGVSDLNHLNALNDRHKLTTDETTEWESVNLYRKCLIKAVAKDLKHDPASIKNAGAGEVKTKGRLNKKTVLTDEAATKQATEMVNKNLGPQRDEKGKKIEIIGAQRKVIRNDKFQHGPGYINPYTKKRDRMFEDELKKLNQQADKARGDASKRVDTVESKSKQSGQSLDNTSRDTNANRPKPS